MVKVKLNYNSDGYIDGWTDEAYASPSATIVDVDTSMIVLGATKLVDGTLKIDEAKQAELYAPKPTAEQQLIASLSLRLAQLEAKS
ncbi:hypothetical protein [Lacticaseibacillus mingshuiensis]|uniref:hypothetical protein n=1 Tax=Lacticaseibacillus mingshuiensis TaxID=2799574 RepID=UPI0019439387|nr:hypothetical protein [Lacticaseibacillus mingshuiensis]